MSGDSLEQAMGRASGYGRSGRLAEAETICREILLEQPNYPRALHLLGVLARHSGRLPLAIDLLARATSLAPGLADAHCDLGVALQQAGRLDESIGAFRRTLQIDPSHIDALNHLGTSFVFQRRIDEAVAVFREAIRVKPDSPSAHGNLGNCLSMQGCVDEAIASYREALRLKPDSPVAHGNLGNAYKEQGRIDLAIECYQRSIELDPKAADRHSNLIYTACFHPEYDAWRILELSRRWDRQHGQAQKSKILPHANDASQERRLRIGYVSPDFREHVVGCNLLPLLRAHDRECFEVYAYSNVLHPDAFTNRFPAAVDGWRNIVGLSDEAAAAMIRADQIDILVDLSLHMAGNRLPLFAHKPAPVQATYLGYCGTTGMESIDYRLSDMHLDPPDQDSTVYCEDTIRLPHCYWCYEPIGPAPAVNPLPALSGGRVTFGCLNSFSKVSSTAIDVWIEILQAIPNSTLLLQAPFGAARGRVVDRFAKSNLSVDRLEFGGPQSWEGYVRTWQRIDLALDPFPYGGGITTCDALWMGVPVVSLSGRTAVGRGGRSILSNIGLPELIADTPRRYSEIAVALARDLPRLRELRSNLRERMENSPLRDPVGFARDIEAAYREMWRRWCSKPS